MLNKLNIKVSNMIGVKLAEHFQEVLKNYKDGTSAQSSTSKQPKQNV